MIPATMSLYMDREKGFGSNWQTRARTVLNIAFLGLGGFLMVGGTYTTFRSIISAYKLGVVGRPFSCA